MIHGDDAVVRSRAITGEKAVRRKWTVEPNALLPKSLECGEDDVLFFCSDVASLAGMGIEPEDCEGRPGDAPVLPERRMNDSDAFNDQ